MIIPTFQATGIENIPGFKKADLRSYDPLQCQLSFEISGSSTFIKQAQSQLLLGLTTATIDSKLVRLSGIQCSTGSDPGTAIICSRFEVVP